MADGIKQAVIEAIVEHVGDRPLDFDTVKAGLQMAQQHMQTVYLKAVGDAARERANDALRKKLLPRG